VRRSECERSIHILGFGCIPKTTHTFDAPKHPRFRGALNVTGEHHGLHCDRFFQNVGVDADATARLVSRDDLQRIKTEPINRETEPCFQHWTEFSLEQHSSVQPEITDWQRRHPLLAAPGLYWRLRKLKVLG
jgi:hypothetical protein